MKKIKDRINYIDISRCFAIFFIVIGHTIVHSAHCGLLYKFLYSFHVALFFMISGFVFNINNKSFGSFIKNKFSRIMIPYFIWSIIFLIPYYLFGNDINNSLGTNAHFSIIDSIFNIAIGNGANNALKQNSSLWFLPALFSTEIIYYIIIRLKNKLNINKYIMIIIICTISFLSCFIKINLLPWGIKTTMVFGIYFYFGFFLNTFKTSDSSILIKILLLIISFGIGVIACFNNVVVNAIDYEYGNWLLMLLSGFCLSLFFIILSSIINKNRIMEYIGSNTMGILLFHKIIIIIFQTKIPFISNVLINSNVILEITLGILVTIISIIFSLIINELLKKTIPVMIGEKKI